MLATLEARQAAGSAQRLEGKQRRLMVTLVGWLVGDVFDDVKNLLISAADCAVDTTI